MAAHNTGGIVIVQVERVVASGTLPARVVHLPGAIVDKVAPNLLLLLVTNGVHLPVVQPWWRSVGAWTQFETPNTASAS